VQLASVSRPHENQNRMRYVILITSVCILFIIGIGKFIERHQKNEAERNAKELRPYHTKVERIQRYECKSVCYRTFVSYKVDAQKRESVFVGGKVAVGQNITAWAKPSFDYAYASPAAYISSQSPT
jgi:Na+-transporting methylmalonyl-CoA/oxaloacetate decarboxylase gamma subunit